MNIRIIGVPEEEDKKKDHEKILEEIIVENFPKMGKEIITQVQETQRVPNRINPRRNTPRHILIKLKKKKKEKKGHPKHSNINKMKRQRNTQQVKEQDKCPPNQTKEEEIGNLPDKEFRIMIVKLIQNLEIKMESQINSLETRIEKMQERFNKDLEEIKKSQYIMNNAINEIKNTLEATNSRITEAEDRISELEDRMVEINESERIKEKRIKRNEDNLRDLQDNIKRYNIRIIGVPEEEDKKKDHEKILEEIIVENFPKMGKEITTQVQEIQRVPNRINPR